MAYITRKPYEEANILVPTGSTASVVDGILIVGTGITFPLKSIEKVHQVQAPTAGTLRGVTIAPSAGAWTPGSIIRVSVLGLSQGIAVGQTQYVTVTVPAAGFANATAASAAIIAALNARFNNELIVATASGADVLINNTAAQIGKAFKVQTFTDDPSRTLTVTVSAAGVLPSGQIAEVQKLFPSATIVAPHAIVKLERFITKDDGSYRKQVVNLYAVAADAPTILTAVTTGALTTPAEIAATQIIDIS